MQTRELGKTGLRISALGLGCMGMSELCGPRIDEESIATIHRALDPAVTSFDTPPTSPTSTRRRRRARPPGWVTPRP